MRLYILLILLILPYILILRAFAVEVILNPYLGINHAEIQSYDLIDPYDECECGCPVDYPDYPEYFPYE